MDRSRDERQRQTEEAEIETDGDTHRGGRVKDRRIIIGRNISANRFFVCCCLYVLATSKVISRRVTVRTHGDFIVLSHLETRLPAL